MKWVEKATITVVLSVQVRCPQTIAKNSIFKQWPCPLATD